MEEPQNSGTQTRDLPIPPMMEAPAKQEVTTPLSPSTTAVDGQGMWRAWKRVFAKPESACLDLLDNCFDAALHRGFHGRVVLKSLGSRGFSIKNNSLKPIQKLEEALTVYKSNKNFATRQTNNHKDSIGENGVGLKHGCATLSDTSFVVTRNHNHVEIGIIAKALQSTRGVYLPSFELEVEEPTSFAELQAKIQEWTQKNASIVDQLAGSFSGIGMHYSLKYTLAQLVHSLWEDNWQQEDHVFLLVLCGLQENTDLVDTDPDLADLALPTPSTTTTSPAKTFLQGIQEMLPEYYINLPSNGMFDVFIDDQRVHFSFWQRRLVELTKFQVLIPYETPFEELSPEDWDRDKGASKKYPLNIYCGFDAQRVHKDLTLGTGTSTCRLYIYSCQAGRLITQEIDARYMLGLSSSGVDYTQGLTIIVNDIDGKLPLTPTKDAIAWSEQRDGEVHKRNLFAWTGAVAQFFWTHHHRTFGKGNGTNRVKEFMKKTIRSFVDDHQKIRCLAVTENMEVANFTAFHGIPWKRIQSKYGNNRWNIRMQVGKPVYTVTKGLDTLFEITKERIQQVRGAASNTTKKRKASAITAAEDANSTEPDICESGSVAEADMDECSVHTSSGRRRRVNYLEMVNGYDHVGRGPNQKIAYTPKAQKKAAPQTAPNTQLLKHLKTELKKEEARARKAELALQEMIELKDERAKPRKAVAEQEKAERALRKLHEKKEENSQLKRQLHSMEIKLNEEKARTRKAELAQEKAERALRILKRKQHEGTSTEEKKEGDPQLQTQQHNMEIQLKEERARARRAELAQEKAQHAQEKAKHALQKLKEKQKADILNLNQIKAERDAIQLALASRDERIREFEGKQSYSTSVESYPSASEAMSHIMNENSSLSQAPVAIERKSGHGRLCKLSPAPAKVPAVVTKKRGRGRPSGDPALRKGSLVFDLVEIKGSSKSTAASASSPAKVSVACDLLLDMGTSPASSPKLPSNSSPAPPPTNKADMNHKSTPQDSYSEPKPTASFLTPSHVNNEMPDMAPNSPIPETSRSAPMPSSDASPAPPAALHVGENTDSVGASKSPVPDTIRSESNSLPASSRAPAHDVCQNIKGSGTARKPGSPIPDVNCSDHSKSGMGPINRPVWSFLE